MGNSYSDVLKPNVLSATDKVFRIALL